MLEIIRRVLQLRLKRWHTDYERGPKRWYVTRGMFLCLSVRAVFTDPITKVAAHLLGPGKE